MLSWTRTGCTRDGEELVTHVLAVLRDEATKPADRLTAATWLADRGFGKPVQTLAPAEVEAGTIQVLWHDGTPA